MFDRRTLLGSMGAIGAVGTAWWLRPTPEREAHAQWALLDRYCTDCHNEVDYTADIAFDRLTPAAVAAEPELFERDLEHVAKTIARMLLGFCGDCGVIASVKIIDPKMIVEARRSLR